MTSRKSHSSPWTVSRSIENSTFKMEGECWRVFGWKRGSTQPKIDLVLGRVTMQRGEMTAVRSSEAKAGTWRLVAFSPSPHGMFWWLVITGQQAGDD